MEIKRDYVRVEFIGQYVYWMLASPEVIRNPINQTLSRFMSALCSSQGKRVRDRIDPTDTDRLITLTKGNWSGKCKVSIHTFEGSDKLITRDLNRFEIYDRVGREAFYAMAVADNSIRKFWKKSKTEAKKLPVTKEISSCATIVQRNNHEIHW